MEGSWDVFSTWDTIWNALWEAIEQHLHVLRRDPVKTTDMTGHVLNWLGIALRSWFLRQGVEPEFAGELAVIAVGKIVHTFDTFDRRPMRSPSDFRQWCFEVANQVLHTPEFSRRSMGHADDVRQSPTSRICLSSPTTALSRLVAAIVAVIEFMSAQDHLLLAWFAGEISDQVLAEKLRVKVSDATRPSLRRQTVAVMHRLRDWLEADPDIRRSLDRDCT